jgi:diguanylate cyclase (GGDEF)-like protein
VRSLSRVLATLLLVSVFVCLAGFWWLWQSAPPQNTISSGLISAQLEANYPAVRQLHAEVVEISRNWPISMEIILLLLCGALCVLAVSLRVWAARQSARRKQAERELKRERCALEQRIQERTQGLSYQVEERKRADGLNHGLKNVLKMLSDPRPQKSEDILRHLAVSLAGQERSWDCSLHLLDGPGKTLRLAASSDVDEKLRRYMASIGADFPDAPEGQACCSGQPFVVEKMTEVGRRWSELLVANGIFSAWSVPFRAKDELAGTLTVYCRLQSGPSPRDLELTEVAAGLAAMIVEHRRMHDELAHNAYNDALTGVPNRRGGVLALQRALDRAQQRQEPLSLFWIDLDRFKRFNDQNGHATGDEILGAMARRLGSHSLVNGNLARMSGDEFLVLIPGAAVADDAAGICRQLLDCISMPIATSAGVLSVAANIGVCCYPRDGMCSQSLERNADFAMCRAKSTGASFCIFSPDMDEEVSESLELEEELAVAIENNYLRMVYQPIYSCKGGLSGFEALLRFRSPKLGEISPVRFIPKAEETGLIVPIGEWVLRQACRQLHAWLAAGFAPIRMGVNVSAVQIARSDFAETVAGIVNECAVPPEWLTLELTETAVMNNPDAASGQMFLLKECGARIALDDFGTGYSSLSYLHKLPMDVLKIDKSFVDRILEPGGTRTIVEAVIAMARHLGLYVVAEGVESREQQSVLQEAGCDALQGYLLGRPMSPQDAGACVAASMTAGSDRSHHVLATTPIPA